MKKTRVFRGVATALATPFDKNGIDFVSFAKMLDFQLESDVSAVVVCGTTGEASTLSESEKRALISFACERSGKKLPVIAGTGGSDTKKACELTEYAAKVGAAAVLAVTPYYNKCTQKGLVAYYKALAEAGNIPVIAYSVPSRTGLKIEPETSRELAEIPLLVGLKDAGDSISDTAKAISLCGENLAVYSGNDDRILPVLSLGGEGVVSVASNLFPKKIKNICDAYFRGDNKEASKLQLDILPLVSALFCEVNPIPLKAALAHVGFCENILRAPLTELSESHIEKVLEEVEKEMKSE